MPANTNHTDHADIKQISNFVFRNVSGLYTDYIPYHM